MIDESKLRKIQITEGSLANNYFNVATILDLFPSGAIGGSSKASEGRQLYILTDMGQRFRTDIAGDKGVFRNRGEGGVADFFRGRFVDGDTVYIYRISDYEYFLSKTMDLIEAKYG